MECKKCREHIPKGRAFCANCGMQVDKMDEYVSKRPVSMWLHEYTVHFELYERAIASFGLAVGVLALMAIGLVSENLVFERPLGMLVINIAFFILLVADGIALLNVRERLDEFRSDAPDELFKANLVFGIGSVIYGVLAILFNIEAIGEDWKWIMLVIAIYALLYAVGVTVEKVYYNNRSYLFTK